MNLNRTQSTSMRKLSLSLVALLAGVTSAYSTIQYTSTSFANSYSNVVRAGTNNQAGLIPDGQGYSAIGTFNVDPATLSTPAQLAGAFTAFGSGTFGGPNVANDPGSYSVGGAVTNPGGAIIPGGTQLYLVFGNVAGADLTGSDEYAVVATGINTPDNPVDPGLAPFAVDLPTALTGGSVVHGAQIPLVTSPTLGGQVPDGPGTVQLVRIPEPSTAVLILGSVTALLVRRRRR